MARLKLEQIQEMTPRVRAQEGRFLSLVRKVDYGNFRPTLRIINEDDLPLWEFGRRVISAAPWRGRPGRLVRLFCADDVSGGLLGIAEVGSDVLGLGPRDTFIRWNLRRKSLMLGHLANLGTCVCVAPFGRLTGGKFISVAVLSREIADVWKSRYGNPLLGISTTSLFGKSSQYNRLKEYEYIGLTKGVGTFHVSNADAEKIKKFWKMFPDKLGRTAGLESQVWGIGEKIPKLCSLAGVKIKTEGTQKKGVYLAIPEPRDEILRFLRTETDAEEPRVSRRSLREISDWWLSRWYSMRWAKMSEEIRGWNPGQYRISAQIESLREKLASKVSRETPVVQTGEAGSIPAGRSSEDQE